MSKSGRNGSEREQLISANALREASPPTQLTGGYRRSDVDLLLNRAAATIERFVAELEGLHDSVNELRAREATLEQRLKETAPRSPLDVAGEMLETAHRAIEHVKEESRLEAAQVVTSARGEAEQILGDAGRRREEAEQHRVEALATLESARSEARALQETVETERARLVAQARAEAQQERNGLELEKSRLDAQIAELRHTWASFIGDTLTRLDAIGTRDGRASRPERLREPEPASEAENARETGLAGRTVPAAPGQSEPEPTQVDVIDDLNAHLPLSARAPRESDELATRDAG